MRTFFLLLVMFFTGCIGAAAADAQPRKPQNIPDQMYLSLVERAQSFPEAFDFKMLRATYEKSSFYNPVNIAPKRDIREFQQRITNGDKTAANELDAYIVANYPLPTMHMELMNWYTKTGEKDKALVHEWMSRGLMNVLARYNSGTGPDTAYKILNNDEIDIVMTMQGLEAVSQREEVMRDTFYTVVRANNPALGGATDTWFDVTRMHKFLTRAEEKR